MENPPSWIGNTSSNGGFSIAMLDYRSVHPGKFIFWTQKKGAIDGSDDVPNFNQEGRFFFWGSFRRSFSGGVEIPFWTHVLWRIPYKIYIFTMGSLCSLQICVLAKSGFRFIWHVPFHSGSPMKQHQSQTPPCLHWKASLCPIFPIYGEKRPEL